MRRRILLAIGGTLLVMLVIISLCSGLVLRDSYANLETRYTERDVKRVTAEIDREAGALGVMATDYGTWTEMYDFARHPTTEFSEENFSESAGQNLHLSVVLVANKEGNVIFVKTLDTTPDKRQLGEHLSWWLASHPWMVRFADADGKAQGIITLPEGILIVASRPVLDTQRLLPVGGAIVMGRLIDEQVIAQISSRLLIAVHLSPLGAVTDPASTAAVGRISSTSPFSLDTSRTDIVSGYAVMSDVERTPSIVVRVDAPRDIFRQGQRTLSFFYFWVLFIGVGFCGVVLLVIERTVLSRLLKLSKGVLAIGTGGDTTRRLAMGGKDQIAYLGAAVNGMLDALAKTTEDLRASERRAEA